jgi:hypothetical protein
VFDLRYHIASLTAVFIAVAVGIVIGVAIASGGAVEKETLALRDDEIRNLRNELDAARAGAVRREDQDRAIIALMEEAYVPLVEGRLTDRRVVVLFLGRRNGGISSAIDEALTRADAAESSVIALSLPVDPDAIAARLGTDPTLALYNGESDLRALGRGLAQELVAGEETPLWDALASELVEEAGTLSEPPSAVVVVDTWAPEETDDPAQVAREEQTVGLIEGVLEGLETADVPAVGVEEYASVPSAIPIYREAGISSVDSIDSIPGKVALVLLLAGGDEGHYGVKDTADAIAPPIEQAATTTTVGE